MPSDIEYASLRHGRREDRSAMPRDMQRFLAIADKVQMPQGGIVISCQSGYVEVRSKSTSKLLHRELFDEKLATSIALAEAKARQAIATADATLERAKLLARVEDARNPRLRGRA
jgi:hypothetical protein